jgi:hypothetical protein
MRRWNGDGNEQGTMIWQDGSKYVGGIRYCKADGLGTKTWSDGRQYVGQFKDGKMDGVGRMTYADGRVEDGFWKDGEFVGIQRCRKMRSFRLSNPKRSLRRIGL